MPIESILNSLKPSPSNIKTLVTNTGITAFLAGIAVFDYLTGSTTAAVIESVPTTMMAAQVYQNARYKQNDIRLYYAIAPALALGFGFQEINMPPPSADTLGDVGKRSLEASVAGLKTVGIIFSALPLGAELLLGNNYFGRFFNRMLAHEIRRGLGVDEKDLDL